MYHSPITIPETHPDYPSVCADDRHRVIVCRDGIQYILQKRKGKQWHNQSFFRHWDGFRQRHGDLALPNGSPMLLQHEIDLQGVMRGMRVIFSPFVTSHAK